METDGKRLIIQICCYNEEDSLPETVSHLPRELTGIDDIKWLFIDDGSSDRTATVAKECGVDYVVSHPVNRGLAHAFATGIEACLQHGADIIVNTDADNQYCADDIPKLLEPLLSGKAEYVIGSRPIQETPHFSFVKKVLQRLGSAFVRLVSGTDIKDAPSGFRAITRDAAMKLNIFNCYTYTLETIIQAGKKNITTASVPIRTNPDMRPSRLVRSIPSYVFRSLVTSIRIFVVYRPFPFFITIGTVLHVAGLALGLRFVIWWLLGEGGGMVQSLILVSILISTGFLSYMMAFVADLLAVNRTLLEELQYEERKRKHQKRT